MTKNCGNCRCFSEDRFLSAEKQEVGYCRRLPRQVLQVRTTGKDRKVSHDVQSHWPVHAPHEWCAEWISKED